MLAWLCRSDHLLTLSASRSSASSRARTSTSGWCSTAPPGWSATPAARAGQAGPVITPGRGSRAALCLQCLQSRSSFQQLLRRGFHARRKRFVPGVAGFSDEQFELLDEQFERLHLRMAEVGRHVPQVGDRLISWLKTRSVLGGDVVVGPR